MEIARGFKLADYRGRVMRHRFSQLALCFSTGLAVGSFSACSVKPVRPASVSADRAYISYEARPAKPGQLRLAVKDLIDVKGTVTTAGSAYLARKGEPAKRDAACLAGARARDVQIIGKTNLTEFAIGTSGINDHFGTPRNRIGGMTRWIPGGSSSGSAVAVANGSADIAFGTDTAGSIRTPAACCGIYGLKTTFGLVPLDGVHPLSPTVLDTVGPMAKDIPHLVQGMDLLQPGFSADYRRAMARHPSGRAIRVGRLYLPGTDPAINRAVDEALATSGFHVVPLNKEIAHEWDEAKKYARAVALADGWRNLRSFLIRPGVSAPTKATILLGEPAYLTNYKPALAFRRQWQASLREVFENVDFIALPTLQTVPLKVPWFLRFATIEARVYLLQNTAPVNLAGNPAIAIPIPLEGKALPVTSLQLIGPRFSEAELVNAARLVEAGLR